MKLNTLARRILLLAPLILSLAIFLGLAVPTPLAAQTSKTGETAPAKHDGGYSVDQVPEGDVLSNDELIKFLREQNRRLKAENAQLKAEIQKLKASK